MGQAINELAQLFKERDNPKQIGTMIGTVISANPVSVSIGKITLDASRLIVAERLTDRIEEVYQRYIDSGTMGEFKKYEIKYDKVLKVGDRVIVSPTEDNQTFIVTDKVGAK